MKDALLGEIEYEFGWIGRCTLPFLGSIASTRLMIPCDEGCEISMVQREAYAAFKQQKVQMCEVAEDAIFAHYRKCLPDLRNRFGLQFADQWAPEVSNATDLSRLVRPTNVVIQQSFSEPSERVIGFLFDCTWEPTLGLAVKFVDERLSDVGTQDIVL